MSAKVTLKADEGRRFGHTRRVAYGKQSEDQRWRFAGARGALRLLLSHDRTRYPASFSNAVGEEVAHRR